MLLSCANNFDNAFMDPDARTCWDRYFIVKQPTDLQDAVQSTKDVVTFLEDHYPTVDADELQWHIQNTSRIVTPHATLSRAFVLPAVKVSPSSQLLRFTLVMAHQIADGMAARVWTAHFQELMNTPLAAIRASFPSLLDSLRTRLILPQEALYPCIQGNKARRRWFWAITLVLRHVTKPAPESFPLPLFRDATIPSALPEERPFADVLPYNSQPILNSKVLKAYIGIGPASKLYALCREADCSVGAGLFVLVAIVMMEFHALRHPDIPDAERKPFAGSFPINPRSLFYHPELPNSCMLAFSSGITLPFLSPSLPLEPRIRLLARSAQRQLSRYQKRPPAAVTNGLSPRERALRYWGPAGPARVLQLNYLDALARVDAKLPPERRLGINPGGPSLVPAMPSAATCCVSSVGRAETFLPPPPASSQDKDGLSATFAGSSAAIRPREEEFLVGIAGLPDGGITINVSYDSCAVDDGWADMWRRRIESLLDEVRVSGLKEKNASEVQERARL
ncbi:hypothetical protein ANO11243_089550 [Dothideomycetidae sp. 11243]|nr:hypothetical protein ANO11243_089550 [fungal sp. No.11243]